jgi:tRNA dimethylallyltransferase
MEPQPNNPPVIVIVGQTASGKTALSLELARRFNGEIIAADSRTVYVGMDIGTAKPTIEDMEGIPHYLIDVVKPDEPFNASIFQHLANDAIRDIISAGKIPIIVGGTGLYIDSVIYNFDFSGQPANDKLRAGLEQCSVDELQAMVTERGLTLPPNERNPRHLVRTLERGGVAVNKQELRANTLILGMQVDHDTLVQKITSRVQSMVKEGLVGEVKRLGATYGWDTPALQTPAYKAFRLYIAGQITLDEAERLFIQQDLQYAKRQKTWFKRNKSIQWISKTEEAVDIVTTFLNK